MNKKIILILLVALLIPTNIYAEGVVNVDLNGDAMDTIEIIILMTLMSLMPAIIIMMTSFTRIIIIFSFLRSSLGLQQSPPNQVLVGLTIFLTLFIMTPVIQEVNTEAYIPYKNEEINQQEFIDRAVGPVKEWMLAQTGDDELQMFIDMSDSPEIADFETIEEIPMTIVIPSFATSELKRAFMMGFLLMIPFLVIDMVVSSALLSMGMMMLPPAMISMPFKILLFVVVDGWTLLFRTIVTSFN